MTVRYDDAIRIEVGRIESSRIMTVS